MTVMSHSVTSSHSPKKKEASNMKEISSNYFQKQKCTSADFLTESGSRQRSGSQERLIRLMTPTFMTFLQRTVLEKRAELIAHYHLLEPWHHPYSLPNPKNLQLSVCRSSNWRNRTKPDQQLATFSNNLLHSEGYVDIRGCETENGLRTQLVMKVFVSLKDVPTAKASKPA